MKITFSICFVLIRSYLKLVFHFLFNFEIFGFSKKKGRSRDHFGHGVTNFGHGVTNWSRQRPTTASAHARLLADSNSALAQLNAGVKVSQFCAVLRKVTEFRENKDDPEVSTFMESLGN